MIHDILEKKLADAGLAVPGETLFRNFMPAEASRGVMTKDPLTGFTIDPYIEGWYKPHMQLIVRHTDPVEGRALCNQVIACLLVNSLERHDATDEHGPCHISLFYPRQEPIQFPRLVGNGVEFSLNFLTAFGIVPAWKS